MVLELHIEVSMKRIPASILIGAIFCSMSFAEEAEFGKHKDAYLGSPVSTTREAVTRVRGQLLSISVGNMDYMVPPEVSSLLTVYKHQVRQMVAASVANSTPEISAETLREKLLTLLSEKGVVVDDADRQYQADADLYQDIYGLVHAVDVKRYPNTPNVLTVAIRYGISCGSDYTLYVFEHNAIGWNMKIALEQNDYTDVAGALGGLEYSISPPASDGNWYLLYGTVNNWCSSNWQGLTYSALRPGKNPFASSPIITKNSGIYIGVDQVLKLTANANDFQVSYHDANKFEAGDTRIHVEHYGVDGETAVRIPPFAASPLGFLDEWSRMPWAEAQRWTSPTKHMARMHRLLQKGASDGIGAIQSCPQSGAWQIEIGIDEQTSMYATVYEGSGEYRVTRLSLAEDPECPIDSDSVDVQSSEPEHLP